MNDARVVFQKSGAFLGKDDTFLVKSSKTHCHLLFLLARLRNDFDHATEKWKKRWDLSTVT